MKTFHIETLGCKVNQYESEQIASFLRARGLTEVASGGVADLRVVNTCSVTVQAASKSRQTVRRMTRNLPILGQIEPSTPMLATSTGTDDPTNAPAQIQSRVLVTGCWATSNPAQAATLANAVVGHHQNVEAELERLLNLWLMEDQNTKHPALSLPPAPDEGRIKSGAADEALKRTVSNKSNPRKTVNENPDEIPQNRTNFHDRRNRFTGTTTLPLLGQRQATHQRAYLKIQDGCDAHCTYCIIPSLRPTLWSKPLEDAVEEARRLVDAGHLELILTGIFLGAYGQPTALRRRQPESEVTPIARLIEALCTRVPGLMRLRLSSLEPGDLNESLLRTLASFDQVVPHFHLPLQSGSDLLLHRMNRQYTRDDFLRMIDQVNDVFDRPAITTDIIVGFPGESDAEFDRTLEVVERSRFIHTHAFPYSPRPGTAAARWTEKMIHGPIVNQRIDLLRSRAEAHSFEYRTQFLGQEVELLVERERDPDRRETASGSAMRHGRCERYFDVHFETAGIETGSRVRVRIDSVTPHRTFGVLVENHSLLRELATA